MPKLVPLDWKTLDRIFGADGWKLAREKGDHRAYTKPGYMRPVVIPTYKSVGIDIIMSNMRTAKMTRERFFELLDH